MKFQKGIPDDTPENSVRFIREIAKEEAHSLNADFDWTDVDKGIHHEVTARDFKE